MFAVGFGLTLEGWIARFIRLHGDTWRLIESDELVVLDEYVEHGFTMMSPLRGFLVKHKFIQFPRNQCIRRIYLLSFPLYLLHWAVVQADALVPATAAKRGTTTKKRRRRKAI